MTVSTSTALRAAAALGAFAAANAANAGVFKGNLVVSTLNYAGNASTVTVGQTLPDCPTSKKGVTACVKAIADGSYPGVFNNDTVDSSFGVATPYTLETLRVNNAHTKAKLAGTLAIPSANFNGSISSKSEGAINLSSDHRYLTLAGYAAPANALDVSNANTPGAVDPTNPVTVAPTQRSVARIDGNGHVVFTNNNSYSGNNPRAVILANGQYYAAGNAGNGSNPQPDSVTATTGVQLIDPTSGANTRIGNFNVTQYGYAPDKQPKDNNFRGETIFNDTLYVTKGSGGNGIDSVYQVGNTGSLPTAAQGLSAPITVLPGFPTGLAATNSANFFPFGIFFANANTLYVADEGDGSQANAGSDANAGLEKWSLVNGTWHMNYALQLGLGLGQSYTVGNYPTVTTDGLRNITGEVNKDGTVTIFGLTSTVSASGDQGADPNRLVSITDLLSATSLPSGESFQTLQQAGYGQVLRGVSLTPTAVAEPASFAVAVLGVGGLIALRRRRAA